MYAKRRYVRHINRDKYSIEQTNLITPSANTWPVVEAANETQQNSSQYAVSIVPPVLEQGMRKVKHLTITMANNTGSSDGPPLFYAIVFVPQGYNPQAITVPANGYAANNYQANQFIMSSGVLDFSAGPTRIRSRLSRNLNSGDSIYLILATNQSAASSYIAQVTYAITLQ